MIYEFLKGATKNSSGLTIEDILNFDKDQIENVHDYIQLLFPLKTKSKFHPNMPVLNDLEINAIKGDKVALQNIHRAVEMMMNFYSTTTHWMKEFDHNLLRITRILNSTYIFFGETYSKNLYEWFLEMCEDATFYSEVAMKFWENASSGKV
jgi:hypothetical protein